MRNDEEDMDDSFEEFEDNCEDEEDFIEDSTSAFLFYPPFNQDPIDDAEEVAFTLFLDSSPICEENTKLSNFFVYENVLFAIDSCYVGDNLTGEEEGDWETLVCFADPEGHMIIDVCTKWYQDPVSMIEGHLAILKNPEIIFKEN